MTSREEKEIDNNDIPEVVICLEPGFNTNVLEKYGYKMARRYYRGSVNGKFIGWSGNENETKLSSDILEEAFIVQNEDSQNTKFIKRSEFKTISQDYIEAGINLRTLAWPFGRCFSVRLPSFQGNMGSVVNQLVLHFNDSVFNRYADTQVKLYFMDQTSSIKVYPDENDMAGDPLAVRYHSGQKYIPKYKIKISRSQHIQGDPLMACDEYTPEKSYNECIKNELLGSFENILGCHPPLLDEEPEKMCNGRFNLSTENEEKIKKTLLDLNNHDPSFKCKRPCTTNLYTSRLMSNIPSSETGIKLVFDRTISVTRSAISINGQTFLTRLGGSVSSGRTLLWILVTLLGAPQVIQ